MSGSSTTDTTTGSKGIFTGSFAAVDYAEYILHHYDAVVTNLLNEQASEQQRNLRKQARESDTGWKDLAKHIKVEYSHEERNFVYSVNGKKNQSKALDLEYGNGQVPPTPFLRSAILQTQYDSEQRLNQKMGAEFMKGY
jgi:hypothetical protein